MIHLARRGSVAAADGPAAHFTTETLLAELIDLGMTHYWPLHESSGASDLIGAVTTNVLGSPDRSVQNPFGDGFSFDCLGNAANYIAIPSGSVAQYAGDFTFSLWYKPTDTTARILMGKASNNNNYIQRGATTLVQTQSTTASTSRAWTAPSIVAGQWEHLLLTRVSGVGELYYNGSKLAGGGALSGTYWLDYIGRYATTAVPSRGPLSHVFRGPVGLAEADVTALWSLMSAQLV